MQNKLSDLYDCFGANLGELFSVVFSGFMLHAAAALFCPHILLLILYLFTFVAVIIYLARPSHPLLLLQL